MLLLYHLIIQTPSRRQALQKAERKTQITFRNGAEILNKATKGQTDLTGTLPSWVPQEGHITFPVFVPKMF